MALGKQAQKQGIMKRTILITGGAGFIGSHVVRRFVNKYPDYKIINADKLTYAGNLGNLTDIEKKPNYLFRKVDIVDKKAVNALFDEFRFDGVIHLAAESHVDRSITSPDEFIYTNIIGTVNLLSAFRDVTPASGADKLFYHISTDEVYGSLEHGGFFTEQTSYDPRSPYSASKASSDHMVRAFGNTYKLPFVISNCSNNYGPFQFPEKLIPLMIMKASRGEKLPVYGDGLNVRDWIHVMDHCRGVELTLFKGRPGQAYNFGGNAEKPNIEVVKTILSALGQPETLINFVKDRPGHDRRYAMDYSLAESELGFTPEYTFERGIAETLEWYAANGAWLEQVQSGAYRSFMDNWYGERR